MTEEELDTVKILHEQLTTLNKAMYDVQTTVHSVYAYECAKKALDQALVSVNKLTNISCTHCDGTGKVSIYV